MINSVRQESFVKALDLFTTPRTVFIIPNFQRPFAWEVKQLQDLQKDIEKASLNGGYQHYLSPIHVVQYDYKKEFLRQYLPENEDIQALYESMDGECFVDKNIDELNFLFVIDGQQRLTTLYIISAFLNKNNSWIELKNNYKITKIIQNFQDDQKILKNLISCINQNKPFDYLLKNTTTLAQKRLIETAQMVKQWKLEDENFVKTIKRRITLLVIELLPEYVLTSFLTLNDRGKDLTCLEKLKSLMIEYASIGNGINSSMIADIHKIYGDIYREIDKSVLLNFLKSREADFRVLQLFFCYTKIKDDKDKYWQSGEQAYSELRDEIFGKHKQNQKDVVDILNKWIDNLGHVKKLFSVINTNLNELKVNSIIFPKVRNIGDDYKIITQSLRLSSRTYAILCRWLSLFNENDLHTKFNIKAQRGSEIIKEIDDYISEIEGKTSSKIIKESAHRLKETLEPYQDDDSEVEIEISILEIAERMELMIWHHYNPKETFRSIWERLYKEKDKKHFLSEWFEWYYENAFIDVVLYGYYDSDSDFRYLLKEYEAFLSGKNIHFKDNITLEHIFPQNSEHIPIKKAGFRSEKDYRDFLNKIGNLTFVSGKDNSRVKDNHPKNKYNYYLKDKQFTITKLVGTQIERTNKSDKDLHVMLELRCAELAIFALKRFYPQYKDINLTPYLQLFDLSPMGE